MFKIESYITPLIIGYVEKYVKNFKPQDAQISLFGGNVNFQNLDLKLNAVEEDLNLPLQFISGHIHELSIQIPWVKLAYEPIVVQINTIEFVVRLKDPNQVQEPLSPQEETKTQVVAPPPPGYLASLVSKIVNNVNVKCNNIILKYIEDDIVLSMNIQHFSLSSADVNWNSAFIDISPIKFLVRKLVKITDLTVCLDRRNSLGKIEVILEPILYRCSLEGRVVTKYNFSTKQKMSLNRIDVLIKNFDINLSTEQLPMLYRLFEQLRALPEQAPNEENLSSEQQVALETEDGAGLLGWMWNSLPTIFSEENENQPISDNEAHIFHLGAYIESIQLTIKQQEVISDSVINNIKKVKFIPIMSCYFTGTYYELIKIGLDWKHTQLGVSGGRGCHHGDCTFQEFFTFNCPSLGNYLQGSLFDPASSENRSESTRYNTSFDYYVSNKAQQEESLLKRTGSVVVLMINASQQNYDSTGGSSTSELGNNGGRANLFNVYVGPIVVKINPDLMNRLEIIRSFFDSYKYPPYVNENIQPLTDDDLNQVNCALMAVQSMNIVMVDASLEIHFWDRTGKSPPRKLVKKSLERMQFPHLNCGADRIETVIRYPADPRLVPTLAQLPAIPVKLSDVPYQNISSVLHGIYGELQFGTTTTPILDMEKMELGVKYLLQPDQWVAQDLIKFSCDWEFVQIDVKLNPPQYCLLTAIIESHLKQRYVDVLNTSLFVDFTNQQLVQIHLSLTKVLGGYDITDDYKVIQVEMRKLTGSAKVPALDLDSHILQWPATRDKNIQMSPNFLSCVIQLPLHEKATKYPPIFDVRVDCGAICFNSLVSRFVNYDLKQWSYPVYETISQLSSKSDTAAVVDTPMKKRASVELRKIPQQIASLQSSDRDANTSMIVEPEEIAETDNSLKWLNVAKHMVLQVDIGEVTVYIPSKVQRTNIFEVDHLQNLEAFRGNDVVIVGLPGVTVLSHVGQVVITAEKVPISLPAKHWTHDKLSYPWNVQLTDMSVATIQSEQYFTFLKRNTTNIIIAVNDIGSLSVDVHVDMKPLEVNFIFDQMNFIYKSVRNCLNFNLFTKKVKRVKRREPKHSTAKHDIDISSSSHAQMSEEIKDFLSFTQGAAKNNKPHSFKLTSTAEEVTDAATTPTKPTTGALSLLVQFTLSKATFVLINCDATSKCTKKFIISFEDIITSYNQRPDFWQLSLKVASAKGECFEKLAVLNEYMRNQNLAFYFRSEAEERDRQSSVIQLLVTSANKADVQAKWRVKVKPELNSEEPQLTEVMLKMQLLDLIVDLGLLNFFIRVFRFDHPPTNPVKDFDKPVTSVQSLPLLDFRSQGLRIFMPVNGGNINCDVLVVSIGSMKMVDPENKINRKPLRPDIYQKALQLGILDIHGTKIENRQYELQVLDIAVSSGNWIRVLESLYKQQKAVHHENPALEWNKGSAPMQGFELDVTHIFTGFNLGFIYAPNIIFQSVLVCEEAIEFNCTNDMTIHMFLAQFALLAHISDQFGRVMMTLKPCSDMMVLNEATNEFVGVSSDLFQQSPTPTKLKKSTSMDESQPLIEELPKRKRLEKRTVSLTHIERRSVHDSGIESLGGVYEKGDLKRKISQLKRQGQIKEIVLLPYEIYFNGGIFTFKLYQNESHVRETPNKTQRVGLPLITVLIDRPNIFIKQTNYEKKTKFSLVDLRFNVSTGVVSPKRGRGEAREVPLFETRPGESDHTGACMPLVEIRHLASVLKPDELDIRIQRPAKFTMSHEKLQILLGMYVTVMIPLQKRRNDIPALRPVPVKKQCLFKQLSNRLGGLKKVNITFAQLMFEISDHRNYDFNITLSQSEFMLSLVERIERINFIASLYDVLLTAEDKTVIHPITLGIEITFFQEAWKNEPLVLVALKSHFIQVDAYVCLLKQYGLMMESFDAILKSHEEVINENLPKPVVVESEAKKEVEGMELIAIHLPVPPSKLFDKEETYEDDLRAGAFQFIEASSTAELPLPYQIQIYSKMDLSIICWRYPQPRSLSNVKLFPVPVQFDRPTVLDCHLEYYCATTERFKTVRKFVMPDNIMRLNLPSRRICASIWRVSVTQRILFDDEDSDSQDEKQNIENILLSEHTFKLATGALNCNPRMFVGCMRVDSVYNPINIPNLELLVTLNHVQLNLMTCLPHSKLAPRCLRNYKLYGELLPPHKGISFSLNNATVHGSVYENLHINLDIETELASEAISYATFSYEPVIENFKTRLYIELSKETKINLITDTIHLHYGQSLSHTVTVLKKIFEQAGEVEAGEMILLTKYIVCNNTSSDLQFGQHNSSEIIPLPARCFHMYAFTMDSRDRTVTFSLLSATNRSPAVHLDKVGVTKCFVANDQIIVVTVEAISSFQKKITVTGQVEFYNMTISPFIIQYRIYPSTIDTSLNSFTDEVHLEEKSSHSSIGRCNETAQESIKIRLEDHTKKGWSGEIPLKEIIPFSKPWLVKVPALNKYGESCFWVRIIRENIEELRRSKTSCPQRILVIIWPLFMLKSNLTLHTTAYEAKYNQNYSIFGRGETKEMLTAGTSEEDHELEFKHDFKSHHGEDKRKARLSYQLIDRKEFFKVPAHYQTIDRAIEALKFDETLHWPCDREEELRCYRENPFQEATLPLFKCGAATDFSCSLMMTVSPWCLFINATANDVKLKDRDGTESCIIVSNNIVMPFNVESFFVIEMKLNDEWVPAGKLYLNNSIRMSGDRYMVTEDGNVTITVRTEKTIAYCILNSIMTGDGLRVLTLLSSYVVINHSKYDLSCTSFAIQSNERATGLKLSDIAHDVASIKLASTDRNTVNVKGTAITSFSYLRSPNLKYRFGTTFTYFLAFYHTDSNLISCPLNLSTSCNRKSFSVICDGRYIPFAATLIQHNEQLYISIEDDHLPLIILQNITDLQLHVAQAASVNPSKTPTPISDCNEDRLAWQQLVPPHQLVYYTPPIIDDTFPDIQTTEFAIIFACVGASGGTSIRWSRALRIDENKEIFLDIPLYGDIKVSVNTDGKAVKIVLDYIRQDTEFSAKDIRARLVNPLTATTELMAENNLRPNETDRIAGFVVDSVIDEVILGDGLTQNCFGIITFHSHIEGFRVTLSTDYDKVHLRPHDVMLLNVEEIAARFCTHTGEVDVMFDSFQIDNLLFNTGDYDFPVLVCPQTEAQEPEETTSVYELQTWFTAHELTNTAFAHIKIELYPKEGGCKSLEIQLQPIKAYIEDTYISTLLEFLNDCFGSTTLHVTPIVPEKERCAAGEVLLPRLVQQQALILAEPVRIQKIKIHSFNALISVHTCIRMYIALDHSPLDFSSYEKRDIFTLPEKLIGSSLTMHYLSSVIFGVGWICGSLEILGSPSGLVRSVGTGVRDFVSMPVQGMFRGPWGFLVGVTQGSASLVKNVTAGTVNSVTKLAASVARNLDRLTLDAEHLQRTDVIRRTHPQSVTSAFTQGLTGLGISLLGALGGLAHHPMQANSPVGVVTGIGKGIVGAVTKPISGAAELVAMTGQGVLQTVGFNSLPSPKTVQYSSQMSVPCRFIWPLLPSQFSSNQILFSSTATLRSAERFTSILVYMVPTGIVIFNAKTLQQLNCYELDDVRARVERQDTTQVVLEKEVNEAEGGTEEYPISSRTIQYVQESLSINNLVALSGGTSTTQSSFPKPAQEGESKDTASEALNIFMEESHAQHFVRYVTLQKRYAQMKGREFSPYKHC